MAIREKMRQLQRQQQAMDDRRRQEMNRYVVVVVVFDFQEIDETICLLQLSRFRLFFFRHRMAQFHQQG
jgi:hypothetical protein